MGRREGGVAKEGKRGGCRCLEAVEIQQGGVQSGVDLDVLLFSGGEPLCKTRKDGRCETDHDHITDASNILSNTSNRMWTYFRKQNI